MDRVGHACHGFWISSVFPKRLKRKGSSERRDPVGVMNLSSKSKGPLRTAEERREWGRQGCREEDQRGAGFQAEGGFPLGELWGRGLGELDMKFRQWPACS